MEKEVGNSEKLVDLMDEDVYNDYPTIGVKTGDSAANISGIKKTGDYSMTVTLDQGRRDRHLSARRDHRSDALLWRSLPL